MNRNKDLFLRNGKLVDTLIRNRYKSDKEIDAVVKQFETQRPRPRMVKGVRKGQYFRVRLPPLKRVVDVPKIPNPTGPTPKRLQSLPPKAESTGSSTASSSSQASQQTQEKIKDNFSRAWEFLKLNGPVLIMNAGSFCTLLAFTRTDVLELRTLSVTGSVCFIIFNFYQTPIKWLTVFWTSLFATVNSYKIVQILNERHSHVELSQEQEDTYTSLFMPHGITPKQFELIEKRAERITVKSNEAIIKQGQKLEHVYLVIKGSTRASILGRYLTAASTVAMTPEEKEKEGAHAGAWVGEMQFLERWWDRDEDKNDLNPSGNSMYTVVAKEDCLVWRWKHSDMRKLMEKSSDMQTALTRAMTSAVMGKVINFTVSRSSARPSWQTWLDNFKHAGVQVTTANFSENNGGGGGSGDGNDDNNDNDHQDNDDSAEDGGAADIGSHSPA